MVNFTIGFVVGTFVVAELVLLFSSFCHYLYGAVSLMTKTKPSKSTDKRPMVSILIPVYNEKDVARTSIEACLALDYPKNRFEIMVVDDSDDGITGSIIDEYKVNHIVRQGRCGFKAGALNAGLRTAKGEIVAVFDSDFAPERKYLKKIVGHFEDPQVAVVQGKWRYRNENKNTIARCASMMANAFYGSVMRYRGVVGTVIFSGSGGAIRKSALDGCGFDERSVAEDLDISLRLLGLGWKTVFAEDTVSTGEAPSSFGSFIGQQTRWAFGTTQAMLNNWRNILFSGRLNLLQKSELLISSSGYLVTPMIVMLYLAGLINTFTRWIDPSTLVWLAVTGAGLGYFFEISVGSLKTGNGLDLAHTPILFAVLLAANIPLAGGVVNAIAGKKMEFTVTPKGSS